ncbi:hemerythrin domain-containing protein [Ectothiorhodospiraceae bacterium 2226]|nr:hemerythrin domain-containing protein [Ectothiorhodospiraceae bacterium 2226]
MEIFQLLKQDHKKVSTLLKHLADTSEDAKVTRKKNLQALENELEVHAQVEERLLYPKLREYDETKDEAEHGIEEHGEMRQALHELIELEVDDPDWMDQLMELKDTIEHHVEEEEEELFPKARKLLGGERAEEMADRAEEEKASIQRSMQ